MFKVGILEDDIMSLQLLKIFINESGRYDLIQSGGGDSVKKYLEDMQYVDLLIVDACTVMNQGGIELMKQMKQKRSAQKIIMITNQPEYSLIEYAYSIGIDSFWYKSENTKEIIIIMDKTMEGEKIYPESTPVVQIGYARSVDFSKRELDVLREVVAGETDASIAKKLNISIRTVKGHIQSIKEKTGFRNRTEMAVRTRESGFVINF